MFYDKLAAVLRDDSDSLRSSKFGSIEILHLFINTGAIRLPDIEGISSKEQSISSSEGTESITQLLTEECIKHLTLAVKAPLPVVIEESAHPYQNHQVEFLCSAY